MRGLCVVSLSLLCVAASACAQPACKAAAPRTLLRAGHVIDVHTGKEAASQTIIVEEDKVTAIARTASTATLQTSESKKIASGF